MPLSSKEAPLTTPRSRRLACDRCHRHKLRCERSPVMVTRTIAVPLGPCKRCMKARVPCQTVAGTFTTAGLASGSFKDRPHSSRTLDAARPPSANKDVSITVSTNSFSPEPGIAELTHDNAVYSTSISSPSLVLAAETSLFDLDSWDFETGNLMSEESTATSSSSLSLSSPVVKSPLTTCCSLGLDEEPDDGRPTQLEDEKEHLPYDNFVDLECLGVLPHHSAASPTHILANHDTSIEEVMQTSTALQQSQSWREECRQRLPELHLLLFNELQSITHTDLAEALFSSEGSSPLNRDRTGPGDNIVHRVLFASERLIELLGIIQAAGLDQKNRIHDNYNKNTAGHHRRSVSRDHGQHTLGSGAGSHFLEEGSPSLVDLPVIISFLTCYVGLLSVYRAIFNLIHETLRSCEPVRRGSQTQNQQQHQEHYQQPWHPAPAQSALALTNQRVLGIRIQLEVMMHMLEQVDDALLQPAEPGGQILFGSPDTMALLSAMLSHEGYDCGTDEGRRMGLGTLVGIQENIRRLLRSSSFI